ncbi:hypothetical protein ONZ45_g17561 [Pleurotus djamor]|nr:hypothetical protein ONZ45_g17561 [Pleurotus djamor]
MAQGDPSLDLTLGALEIGFMVSGCLFGVLTAQVAVYNRNFQARDNWLTRLLVGAIWCLELGQLLTHFHGIYYLVVIHHQNKLALLLPPPRSVGVSFLISSCIGPLVESFYVSRFFRLSKHLLPALLGWGLALCRLAGWLYISVHALRMTSFTHFTDQFGWLLETLFSASAFIDLAIALANFYYLAKSRSRTTQGPLIMTIDRIIAWTLQTGLITSISFVITLLCFLFSRQNLIWMAVSSTITKGRLQLSSLKSSPLLTLPLTILAVFSNCLLASLNARVTQEQEIRSQSSRAPPNQTILSFVAGGPEATVINTIHASGRRSTVDVPIPPMLSPVHSIPSGREFYWAT